MLSGHRGAHRVSNTGKDVPSPPPPDCTMNPKISHSIEVGIGTNSIPSGSSV